MQLYHFASGPYKAFYTKMILSTNTSCRDTFVSGDLNVLFRKLKLIVTGKNREVMENFRYVCDALGSFSGVGLFL